MEQSSQRITVKRNGDQFGPYTLDETRAYLAEGRLLHSDTAIIEGTEEWLPVAAILGVTPEQLAPKPEVKAEVSPVPELPSVVKPEVPPSEPPPLPSQNLIWYYSENGKRTGPVSEDQLRQLISTHTINEHTLIWRVGMSTWTAAYQTEVRTFFGSKPPPLPGEGVNNKIVWTLAFAPIGIAILDGILLSNLDVSHSIWYVGYIVNTLLCYMDAQKLKSAGYDTKGMSNWIVIVPVYLFIRASRLKQSPAYAIVWLITFFISLYI